MAPQEYGYIDSDQRLVTQGLDNELDFCVDDVFEETYVEFAPQSAQEAGCTEGIPWDIPQEAEFTSSSFPIAVPQSNSLPLITSGDQEALFHGSYYGAEGRYTWSPGLNDRALTQSFNPFDEAHLYPVEAERGLLSNPCVGNALQPAVAGPFGSFSSYGSSSNDFENAPIESDSRCVLAPSSVASSSSSGSKLENADISMQDADHLSPSGLFQRNNVQGIGKGPSYWLDYQGNKKGGIALSRNASKRNRGRKGPLATEAKVKAAQMRKLKACSNCRRRKSSCDAGTPCRACVAHFKADLVNHPCREAKLESLATSLLAGKVFPSARSLDGFLGEGEYSIKPGTSMIELVLGFGPSLLVRVRTVVPNDTGKLRHLHTVYEWPPPAPGASVSRECSHQVLPAVLADTDGLEGFLDLHLSRLVDSEANFRNFPLYRSPLRVLREVFVLYKRLDKDQVHLLHQALKLLVLVHIGGNIKLDQTYNNDLAVASIMTGTRLDIPVEDITPCFIRGQLGAVIPALAERLLKDILNQLEERSLTRDCSWWPVIVSTFAVILMASESMQYHAAIPGYHANLDGSVQAGSSRLPPAQGVQKFPDDSAIDSLLNFYRNCYSDCHARLRHDSLNPHNPVVERPVSNFIRSLRLITEGAAEYLEEKGRTPVMIGSDVSCYFDRSLAKLFLLQTASSP